MLKLGDRNISKLYLGGTAISKAYLGSNLVWSAAQPLPYDAEVEYLENTGSEYISTNLLPDLNYVISGVFLWTRANGLGLFGVYEGERKSYRIFGNGETLYWDCGDAFESVGRVSVYGLELNSVFSLEAGNRFLSVNGDEERRSENQSLESYSNCIRLFSIGNIGSDLGRIYSLSISRMGQPIADYIPVRKDGVGYIFDRVSGQLLGNSGTGNFIVGPDKQ